MIMPRGADQLLLPVNPFFIGLSLLVALAVNLLPAGRHPAQPDLLAVVLVFWNVHQPRRVGVGLAFLFGLLMDVHEGALLGQHALAYTLLSFAAIAIHRRLTWFGLAEQALHILPVFFAAHLVALVVRMQLAACSPAGGCCWHRCSRRCCGHWPRWLLLAPQRRAPDPDENRPL
jgi:rod shape-determining protein MreD